ncbi:MAG: tetratricopeptide repeat protein [Pseudomonadota bacterium]
MKPSSDTAMIHTHPHKTVALTALMLSTLVLGGCGMFASKPSPSTSTKGGASTLPGTPAAPGTKPVAPKPIDKGDPDARFKGALELYKQGQAQEAEAALTELVKDFPQYSGPLTELGMIYAKSKRFDLAANAFAKAIANNSDNAVAYNWQGILFRQANNYARAEQSYKRALSINSSYANAHLNLGILYDVYLKRPDDALEHYKDYQRLGGADDLRVLVWVAELEKAKAPPAAPVAAPVAATPPVVKPIAPAPAPTPAKPKPTEKKP